MSSNDAGKTEKSFDPKDFQFAAEPVGLKLHAKKSAPAEHYLVPIAIVIAWTFFAILMSAADKSFLALGMMLFAPVGNMTIVLISALVLISLNTGQSSKDKFSTTGPIICVACAGFVSTIAIFMTISNMTLHGS